MFNRYSAHRNRLYFTADKKTEFTRIVFIIVHRDCGLKKNEYLFPAVPSREKNIELSNRSGQKKLNALPLKDVF